MERRVVVTGIGVVCPIGTSLAEFWGNCLAGRAAVDTIPPHWTEYSNFKSTLWAPLPTIDYAERGIGRSQLMQFDPVSLNAILAAQEAATGAGWSRATDDHNAGTGTGALDTGVYIGTGIGGGHTFLENHLHPAYARARKRLESFESHNVLTPDQRATIDSIVAQFHHPRRINPFMASMYMPNAVAAALGIQFGLRGPNQTYCQACASGTVAVGRAFQEIRAGNVKTALAGGSEYFYDHHGYLFQAFDVAGTLVQKCDPPETANRPFDEKRSGFLFSQGASVILALESLENAVNRGAPILAEVSGYAESFDAHNMMAMAPGGEQIERMIRSAVGDAGLTVEAIDYINAHGTGTLSNDAIEAEVLERVFGNGPLINATKSLVGHTIGASGALEAAVLALSLYHQATHPTCNLSNPIADLNFATGSVDRALNCGISESFAFGGHNAAVVMKRFEDG